MKNGNINDIGNCNDSNSGIDGKPECIQITEVHEGFFQFIVPCGFHMQKGMKNLGRIDYSFNEKLDEGITIEKD